jgi:hypothetical protein
VVAKRIGSSLSNGADILRIYDRRLRQESNGQKPVCGLVDLQIVDGANVSATDRSPAQPLEIRRQSWIREKALSKPYLCGNNKLSHIAEIFRSHTIHA